jgi:hypothetical protein
VHETQDFGAEVVGVCAQEGDGERVALGTEVKGYGGALEPGGEVLGSDIKSWIVDF